MAKLTLCAVYEGIPGHLHARLSTSPWPGGGTFDVLVLPLGGDTVEIQMIEHEQIDELIRSLQACSEALHGRR